MPTVFCLCVSTGMLLLLPVTKTDCNIYAVPLKQSVPDEAARASYGRPLLVRKKSHTCAWKCLLLTDAAATDLLVLDYCRFTMLLCVPLVATCSLTMSSNGRPFKDFACALHILHHGSSCRCI